MFLVVKMYFGSVEKYRGARGGAETKNIKNLSPSAKKTGRDVILHVRP